MKRCIERHKQMIKYHVNNSGIMWYYVLSYIMQYKVYSITIKKTCQELLPKLNLNLIKSLGLTSSFQQI